MVETTDQIIAHRFRMERELGRGGFGVTWSGVELSTGRPIAIKELDMGRVGDWKAVDLFEREARTLAGLNHPRIPDYVDFIPVAADKTGYLIQELAPGADLQRVVVQGQPFSEERARTFASQMLDILEYLASQRPPVVHRDIKPSNILIDEKDEIYLVDFGSVQDVARRTSQGGSTVAGTFGYMAPEQLRGIATPASDLYGLGMTMLFLLSGHEPETMPQARLKVDFRKVLRVSKPMAEFLDRLIEPVAEDRFSTPTEARRFLDGTRPSPALAITANRASGSEIAKLVKERQDQEKRNRQLALTQASALERQIIETTPRRINVERDPEGLTLALCPPRLSSRLLMVLPITGFLFVNPGVFIIEGEVFLGQFWPVFSDYWPGRLVIWTIFCLWLTTFSIRRFWPFYYLRITEDGHFALSRRGKKNPVAVGRRIKLHIHNEIIDGYGQILLTAGPKKHKMKKLNPLDVQLLNEELSKL